MTISTIAPVTAYQDRLSEALFVWLLVSAFYPFPDFLSTLSPTDPNRLPHLIRMNCCRRRAARATHRPEVIC